MHREEQDKTSHLYVQIWHFLKNPYVLAFIKAYALKIISKTEKHVLIMRSKDCLKKIICIQVYFVHCGFAKSNVSQINEDRDSFEEYAYYFS